MSSRELLYGTSCHHNYRERYHLRQTFMAEGKNYALSLKSDCDWDLGSLKVTAMCISWHRITIRWKPVKFIYLAQVFMRSSVRCRLYNSEGNAPVLKLSAQGHVHMKCNWNWQPLSPKGCGKERTSVAWVLERTIPPDDRSLSSKLVPTFANRGNANIRLFIHILFPKWYTFSSANFSSAIITNLMER
jgi:hypothetical protein